MYISHPVAALRALVTNDDDFAGLYDARQDRLIRLLLGVEAAGAPGECLHGLDDGRRFGDPCVGGKVALQNRQATAFAPRGIQRSNDAAVAVAHPFEIFGDGLARHGAGIWM